MTSRLWIAPSLVCGVGLSVSATFGQQVGPDGTGRSAAVATNSRSVTTGRLNMETLSATIGPKAIGKVDGIPAAGLKLTLDGSASTGGRVWYRWIQTQGTRVTLQGADSAVATFVVPAGDAALSFVLVVGNGAGVDARALDVAITGLHSETSDQPLKAEAGADQTTLVGQRVQLDGTRSEPHGHLRFRWVQTNGPRVADLTCHGPICSFVPDVAGVYQFALLVLGDRGLVSEAALVSVRATEGKNAPAQSTTVTGAVESRAIDELARASVVAIPGGLKHADELARAFDAVADRIDSFKTYLEAATEMTRRLDAVVPREPALRARWMDLFFKPWTARVTEVMRDDKLDLTLPAAQAKPLSKPQRNRLAEQFRFTAAGLRAGATLR